MVYFDKFSVFLRRFDRIDILFAWHLVFRRNVEQIFYTHSVVGMMEHWFFSLAELHLNMDDHDAPEFMDDDSQEANSPVAENDQTVYEDLAAGQSLESVEVSSTRTLGQPLSDFLMTLEDYTPTVSKIKTISCECLL